MNLLLESQTEGVYTIKPSNTVLQETAIILLFVQKFIVPSSGLSLALALGRCVRRNEGVPSFCRVRFSVKHTDRYYIINATVVVDLVWSTLDLK